LTRLGAADTHLNARHRVASGDLPKVSLAAGAGEVAEWLKAAVC
jgi:hypothetical protein